MKYPIPRPKQITYNDRTVPASFFAKEFDPIFADALNVFQNYARRAFGDIDNTDSSLILRLDPTLDDGYRISIQKETVITASDNVGMNYAFATLLQLATVTDTGVVFPCCEISDHPDSEWRGVMLDLSRCYHEKEYLYALADLCWFYKISRFQLHLTDDQGVRFPFSELPDAVSDEHYSKAELTGLVNYCRERGITSVPEIDVPGHFRAFNTAYPHLFGVVPENSAQETTAQTNVISGIMRAEEGNFSLLQRMFREVADVFTDSPWIHMGGDEADIAQWENCAVSTAYQKEHGLKDTHELYGHCIARFSQMILDLGRIPVVWEGFNEKCNHMIPKETLVFSWESYYQIAPSLLKGGFKIINASWVPLYIVSPDCMWSTEKILEWEKNIWQHFWEKSEASRAPIEVTPTDSIIGGQLCVWGDRMQPSAAYAPRHDMLRDEFSHLRLRLPALAEKTWTSYNSVDKDAFTADLAVHDKTADTLLNNT